MTWGVKVGSDYDFDGCPISDTKEGEITWDSYSRAHKDEGKSDEELKRGFLGSLARELSDKYKK